MSDKKHVSFNSEKNFEVKVTSTDCCLFIDSRSLGRGGNSLDGLVLQIQTVRQHKYNLNEENIDMKSSPVEGIAR